MNAEKAGVVVSIIGFNELLSGKFSLCWMVPLAIEIPYARKEALMLLKLGIIFVI